ncbi:Cardiolipin synthase [Rubinisphaera italica]|uniref:Cardiolipin synthase n=1 Tax=Rubinisphaera italica TaxID=2527969 RepID=A0A5C5XF11_9PLAN|nr:cardiolipin synthase [Rubinisphaera italica]TWT60735.1 Cardiolipin synthase [Rubinisphaera italica]
MGNIGWIWSTVLTLELVFIVRAIIRPHRSPASRIAWVVVIGVIPFLGIFLYVLFGETNIGYRKKQRVLQVQEKLRLFDVSDVEVAARLQKVPEEYQMLFRTAGSISRFPVVAGNVGKLFSDSNETISSIIADIDAAKQHVHIVFYIWLADNNGCRMVEALIRASKRGVICRVIVDEMGSRDLIRSRQWMKMKSAGVFATTSMPIGNFLLKPLRGRIDLRNHRKIVVIDDWITYCGSQNCADPEFRIKAKYAPWVDAVIRFEGPVAQQNQHLFASDWMTHSTQDLSDIISQPLRESHGSIIAQAFGTGPTVRDAAMSEMFVSMMYAARQEIIITTPYYVPDESMQHAVRAAAHRGVNTTIIFPAKNDSRIVAAASESYYPELLDAGVKVFEFTAGLLHTKSFTVDGCVTLIGSANHDRRSFDLNYENNILCYDSKITGEVRDLQLMYLSKSDPVTEEMVAEWSLIDRLWRNSIAMLGPLL